MASNRRIRVLIPAAGQSIRYQDKGYAVRKPFLTIRDRHGRVDTMLGHVVRRVPMDVELHIAVPEGYEYVDHHGRQPIIRQVSDSASQVETVHRLIDDYETDCEILVIDADTMAPVAGMLEFIDHHRPCVAVAVTAHPDEYMGRVDRNFRCSENNGRASGEFGVVGMRYFSSMLRLSECVQEGMQPDQIRHKFSDVMNLYAAGAEIKQLYHVQWFEDWGTPQKLEATGASIA